MITLEQAKTLSVGDIIYYKDRTNTDGSPERWKVNGKPKTWKTKPNEVQVPIKHGLYSYSYLYQNTLKYFALTEEEAIVKEK